MLLQGKNAIITGAGRGIGRAIAEAFAAQGCNIAALARSEDEIEETASIVRGLGVRVPFEVAQDDRQAVPLGQPREFFVNDREVFGF